MAQLTKTSVSRRLGSQVVYRKVIIACLALVLAFLGGREFYELRYYEDTFVVSEDFTEKKMLGDYLANIKGTWVDTPIYIFDSGVPGGSVLYLAGTHPYEPASSLSAYILMENIKIERGKVFVIAQANRSASTLGMLGNAYPMFYHIQTEFGSKKFRIGDRGSNPLDHWPDPFTYVHYPSGQNLAYQDIRNLNRVYPGRKNGTLTERLAFAIMELIRQEDIAMYIDVHEASLMYPVVSTYVAHERSLDICMMSAMNLTATEFNMKCEASPKNLRGLSHREVGDYSNTLALLMETPEPFIDRVAGRISEQLMLDGKDEFVQTAAEKGLLYCEYDIEEGAPMKYRVGRHLSGAMEAIKWMGSFYPEKAIEVSWPMYSDLMEKDCGYFLHDPAEVDPDRVFKN